MASTVVQAYNGGLGVKPPEAESFFSFWTSNISSKICLIRLTVADSINHMYDNLTTMAWTIPVSDINL